MTPRAEPAAPTLPANLPERPHTLVFVACAARTGSSLLTAAMATTGALGRPDEYLCPGREHRWAERWGLAWPDAGYDAYVDMMLRQSSTPNGVASIKVFASHMLQQMSTVFTGPDSFDPCTVRFIHLRRTDKVRAALSEWRAHASGQWMLAPGQQRVPVDGAPATWELTRFHEFHHAWDRVWLAARADRDDVLELFYEDVAADVGKAMRQVTAHVGVDTPPYVPEALPQRLARSGEDEWIRRWVHETGGCAECGHV